MAFASHRYDGDAQMCLGTHVSTGKRAMEQ